MKWKNQINVLVVSLRKMNYIFRNLNKILELPNLHQVYLILESVI